MTHRIRISGSDFDFPSAEGQTVLDAALRAGIEMPYSCCKGVCGNCAGAVITGEVHAPISDLTPPGTVLFCQSRALSDLEIRPASWHRIDPSARKIYTLRVYRNTRATEDVSVLQLRLPAGQRAKFRAGQYLQIAMPDGSRRSYSMANPPHENDMLTLHIRHLPGGLFSSRVRDLAPGDTLQAELPYGSFALEEGSRTPMVCVVGGTGFAPVKSLLDDMVKKGVKRPVTLLWGARDRHGLYLSSAAERWQRAWSDFRFLTALEDADDARLLEAIHGRVDAALCRTFDSLAGHDVYCCGGPPMVASVRRACLETLHLDPQHFFSDVFVPGPAAVQ